LSDISWLAVAVELLLGLGAALILLIDVQWKPPTRVLGQVTAVLLGGAAVITAVQWVSVPVPDPARPVVLDYLSFNGFLVTDYAAVLGRGTLLVAAGLGVAAGWRMFVRLGRRAAEALALVLLATTGFSFMASTPHLVMMFLGLEVGSISLYVLAGITRERAESDEAALKYFLLGSLASAVFIYGVALLYAGTGSLEVGAVGAFTGEAVIRRPAVLLIGVALIIAGLGFKVSAAPFHSWAPDVYQGAPAGLVGFMAAVAKIGGFAALLRILTTAVPALAADWVPVVATVAALSMAVGVLLAIVQDDIRRMLAYSGVAHAGFILTGVVAGGAGSDSVWFYLAVYSLQLIGAFAVVAAVGGASASRSELTAYSGLYRRNPFVALTFTVLLLGMGGLPLTSGFIAKFGVFTRAWEQGEAWLVIVAVVASVVALFIYLRVIVLMYMNEPVGKEAIAAPALTRWVLGLVSFATLFFGVLPRPLLELAGNVLPF
jgi:NADH-quinone oxidoreductase subunit N